MITNSDSSMSQIVFYLHETIFLRFKITINQIHNHIGESNSQNNGNISDRMTVANRYDDIYVFRRRWERLQGSREQKLITISDETSHDSAARDRGSWRGLGPAESASVLRRDHHVSPASWTTCLVFLQTTD